jgi:hypothetical protein
MKCPQEFKSQIFEKNQFWLVIILDRDAKTIFVRSRGGVLLQGYFKFGVSYFSDSIFRQILNGFRRGIFENAE